MTTDRLLRWIYTGPPGHLWSAALDIASLLIVAGLHHLGRRAGELSPLLRAVAPSGDLWRRGVAPDRRADRPPVTRFRAR